MRPLALAYLTLILFILLDVSRGSLCGGLGLYARWVHAQLPDNCSFAAYGGNLYY